MNKKPTLVLHLVTTVLARPRAMAININFLFLVTNYYCQNIIRGARSTSAELLIKNYARLAYFYSIYTLEGRRWPEAEPAIMKNPEYAYLYARDIRKTRWPEAEKYIMKDSYYWECYFDRYLKNK
jgi:hypothetical protein